jgi:thiol-disulfide isomerase/thioredoxin
MIPLTLSAILSMALIPQALAGGGGMPDRWWLNTEGLSVTSNQQYKELVSGSDPEYKDKHVFIDFYMQGCFWCYKFQAEWNQIVNDLSEEFGDSVVFMKIDGNNVYEVSRKYGV